MHSWTEYASQFVKNETSVGKIPLTGIDNWHMGISEPVSQKPYPIATKITNG